VHTFHFFAYPVIRAFNNERKFQPLVVKDERQSYSWWRM